MLTRVSGCREPSQGRSVIHGHTHRADAVIVQNIWSPGRIVKVRSAGCLCRLVPLYGTGRPVEWVHAFILGYLGRRSDALYTAWHALVFAEVDGYDKQNRVAVERIVNIFIVSYSGERWRQGIKVALQRPHHALYAFYRRQEDSAMSETFGHTSATGIDTRRQSMSQRNCEATSKLGSLGFRGFPWSWMSKCLRGGVTGLVMISALFSPMPRASAQTQDVRLTVEEIRVDQQRERGGDRPYFATFQFRVDVGVANTARVMLREGEPHDWVGKEPFRSRLPEPARSAGHMRNGNRLAPPWWMSEFQWRGITIREPAAPLAVPIFGVLILCFDNNNTPPHEIRGLLTEFKNKLRQEFEEQVGRGRIIEGIDLRRFGEPAVQRQFSQRLESMITRALSNPDMPLSRIINFTLGSTFNPDQPTGAAAFVFIGLRGLGRPRLPDRQMPEGREQPLVIPVTVRNSRVEARAFFGEPEALVGTHEVQLIGTGARYTARVRIDAGPRPVAPIHEIEVAVQIGADDVRGGTQLHLELLGPGGRTHRFDNINSGRELGRWTDHVFLLRVPAGWNIRDVASLRMSYSSGPGISTDNVDLVTLKVATIAHERAGVVVRPRSVLLFLQGDTDNDPERSLWRFKGDRPSVTFSTIR